MDRILGNKTNFIMILLSAAVLMLTACAGRQLEVKPISKSENPQQLINQLDNDIALAHKNQLNVLAPTWYKKAESSFNAAKNDFEKGNQLSKILDNIATGRAQLGRAEEIAKISRTTLPKAIKARQMARDAGATTLGKDYADTEGRFLKLTQAIEDNDLKYAQRNQTRVVEGFRVLELRAIKVRTIGEVRRLIKDAENKDMREMAPQSFAAAEKKLAEVDAFISQNPYQKEKMHKIADEALFMAQRLHVVAEQSAKLETMEVEQITLWTEKILYKT